MIAYLHLFDYGWGIQTHFYIQNPSVLVELFPNHQHSSKSWQHNIWYSKSQFDLWKLKAYDWYGFYTFLFYYLTRDFKHYEFHYKKLATI